MEFASFFNNLVTEPVNNIAAMFIGQRQNYGLSTVLLRLRVLLSIAVLLLSIRIRQETKLRNPCSKLMSYGRIIPFFDLFRASDPHFMNMFTNTADHQRTDLPSSYVISHSIATKPYPGRGLKLNATPFLGYPRGRLPLLIIVNILAGDIQLNPGPATRIQTQQIESNPTCPIKLSNSFECLSDLSDDPDSGIDYHHYKVTNSSTTNNRQVPKITLRKCVPKITLKKVKKGWTIVSRRNKNSHRPCNTAKPNNESKIKSSKSSFKKDRNILKILIANFQGIKNKTAELITFNKTEQPDIILGCESWLDGSIPSAEMFPENFCVTRNDRKHAGRGGVFIATKSNIPILERPDLCPENCEVTWCQLLIGRSDIFIGSYYRPHTGITSDINNLETSLSKIFRENKNPYIILGGDFNVPDMDWDPPLPSNPLQNDITKIANDHGLEQMVLFPTRRDINGTKNILDLCFTTHPSHVDTIYEHSGFGDHSAVIANINTKIPIPTKPRRKINLWKKVDDEKFIKGAQKMSDDFLESHPETKTVENNWCSFRDSMSKLINDNVPTKMVSGQSRVPWLTSNLQRLCRKKEKTYSKAKRLGGESRWAKYRRTKTNVNKQLRKARRSYISNISDAGNKEFWKFIKTRRKDNVGVQSLKVNNRTVTDDQGKADVLANQFQSVFSREDNQVPDMPDSPHPDMPEIHFSVNGVTKLLKGLNISKASGPDKIPNRALKMAAEQISPVLTFIFNQSYSKGILPDDWRRANIASIFKKGAKSNPANYRPVSLTSVCCKLMEHIVDSQLMNHLSENSIITDYQHAFRSQRSCETQLIATIHDLAEAHNDKNTCDIAILDFSKAFDVVPHGRLLQKLNFYGIRNKTLQWIKSFLTNRHQRTVVNGKMSKWMPVLSGIPQGTVLGPHLFILFINDIINSVKTSTARLFADDCIIYKTIANQADENLLQNDLDNLLNWADKWGMKFNASKCNVMRISRQKDPGRTNYKMMGEQLGEVTTHQYLGVHIQNNLKWNKQAKHASDKATKILNFIRRNFHNCSKSVKVRLYQALVRPHIEYASVVWNPVTSENQNLLDMVQKRAARFVLGDYDWQSSTSNMLHTLNWIPLEKRRENQCLTTLHKIINGELALDINIYANKKPSRQRRTHNQQYNCNSNFISASQFKSSFFPSTIAAWNKLPNHLVTAKTSIFKSLLQAI